MTPAAGPEASVQIGRCPASRGEAKPPFDCWMFGFAPRPRLCTRVFELIEIAAHHRAERGIQDRRAGALVFAEFGQHLMRRANELAGQRLAQPRDDILLVAGLW